MNISILQRISVILQGHSIQHNKSTSKHIYS